jgi:nicotinamidase-related amidase
MATSSRYTGLDAKRSDTVLLILDVISRFEFPDGRAIARAATRIAPRIAQLKQRIAARGWATIYVNDNPGRWRSDGAALIREAAADDSRGRAVMEALRPTAEDFLILKPRHSAFYGTPLGVLLEAMQARRLVLTGVSSHQCVLFTANDAHVRSLDLVIPSDCVAAPAGSQTRLALAYFKNALDARVMPQSRWRP